MGKLGEFLRDRQRFKRKVIPLVFAGSLVLGIFGVTKVLNAKNVVIRRSVAYSILRNNRTGEDIITATKRFEEDDVLGYCLDESKPTPPSLTVMRPTGAHVNDQVFRAVKEGYPHRKWFSDGSDKAHKMNFYVTQLAVWHYTNGISVDDINNASMSGTQYRLSGLTDGDVQAIKNCAKELISIVDNSGMSEVPAVAFDKGNVTAYKSGGGNSLVTDWIYVYSNNISGNMTVSLEGAPSGAVVRDSSGNERYSYSSGERFYVEMPYRIGGGSFSYTLSASGQSYRGVVYNGGGNYQEVVRCEPTPTTINAGARGTVNWSVSEGSIMINKTGESGPLQGATFKISNPTVGYESSATTDGNGQTWIGSLLPGTYQIQETSAPYGYVLDSQVRYVEVTGGNTNWVNISNRKAYGSLSLKKTDEHSGAGLGGATFRVWNNQGTYDQSHTTDSSGNLNVGNLPLGNYNVQETKAPSGYELNGTVHKFDINNDGESRTITHTNHPHDGSIRVVKKSVKGDLLKDATFQLTGPGGFDQSKTTGDNGEVSWTALSPGTYTLKETKAPHGYDKQTQTWTFEISKASNQHSYTKEIMNTMTKADVKLMKVDSDTREPLAGAQFRVKGPDGYDTTVTSGESGRVTLKGITLGTYTIQEIKSPEGYVLDNREVQIEINDHGKTYEINIPNKLIRGNIEIEKSDAVKGKLLAGAQYKVTGPNNFSKTVTTDDKGKATLTNLPYGVYTITEVKAPEGYKLNATSKQVNINSNGTTYKVKMQNEKLRGGLKVVKTDDLGGLVQGAVFELKCVEYPEDVYTQTTDSNGVLQFTNIPYGEYDLREASAPNGYIPNTEVKRVTINSTTEVKSYTYVNVLKRGSIEILKVDKETQQPLANAKFRVQTPNGYSKVVVTNSKGIAVAEDAPLGTYTITELTAPNGYVLDTNNHTIKVTDHGKKYSITLTNDKAEGGVSVTKVNAVGNRLTGATFELKSKTGAYTKTMTTPSSGVVTFEKVPFGSYTLRETKAPEGYLINDKVYDVEVNTSGKMYTYTHENTKITGKVKIQKLDSRDKKPLANAEFRITGPSNFDKTAKTNDKGLIELSDVPYGEYTITEIKQPNGYVLNTTPQTVNITENGKTYSVTFENDRAVGNVKVTKKGENNDTLRGAEFELKSKANPQTKYNVTTGNDGVALFEDIPFGDYILRESEPPEGYTLNPATYDVTIDKSEKTYPFEHQNEKIRGDIQILKVDKETNKPLAGAEFKLTGPNGYEKTIRTDDSGIANLTNLEYGVYKIVEVKASTGYVLNDTPQTVNITEDGKLYTVTFKNMIIKGNIEIFKKGTDDKKIQGVEFELKSKADPTKVLKAVSNDKGKVVFENVKYGKYILKETKTPPEYLLNPKETEVNINTDKQVIEIEYVNQQVLGSVEVLKVDKETSKPLENAKFELVGANGFKQTGTTNEKGKIEFTNVPYGKYTVKEVKAPEGYLLNEKEFQVNVTEHKKVYPITATNQKIKANVEVTKKGDDGPLLEGAKFELKSKANPDVVFTKETDENGKVVFKDVEYGAYTLREVKPPVGYLPTDKVLDVVIKEHYGEYKYEYVNEQIKGDISIQKIDAETKAPLKGATFKIEKDGKVYAEIKSNENGIALLEDVPYGDYVVTEIKAPTNFLLNKDKFPVEIREHGKVYSVTVSDVPKKGLVSIKKVDKHNNEPLEGIEFELLDANKNLVEKLVTNEKGIATSKPLRIGKYIIREIKTKDNYVLNTTEFPIEVMYHDKTHTIDITNRKKVGKLRVVKFDKETQKPLSNAEFRILKDDKKTVVHEGKTGIDGTIDFSLEYGDYYYQEVKAPKNYTLDDTLHPFKIRNDGEVIRVEVPNVREAIKVTINKQGTEFKVGLKGAVYEVHHNNKALSFTKDGVATTRLETDSKGNIAIPVKLDVGKYQLVEVEAPTGYNIAPPYDFEITPELVGDGYQTVNYDVTDEEIRGNVKLTKTENEINKPLEGVKFELTRLTDVFGKEVNESLGVFTTDANGVIEVKGLLFGSYQFKEVAESEGYLKDETPIPFVIQEQGHTIELGMDNKIIKGGALLIKKDSRDKERLPKVEFELYKISDTIVGNKEEVEEQPQEDKPVEEEDTNIVGKVFSRIKDLVTGEDSEDTDIKTEGELIGTYTTDKWGRIVLENLRYGQYRLVETKPAEGYLGKGDYIDFVIQENKHVVELEMFNDKIQGELEITKKDISNGDLLPNAKFRIYADDKETVLLEGTTNDKGLARFKLDYGKYYYQEFEAPRGYVIDEDLYPFEIKENGEVVKAEMDNEKIKGKLKITKTDIVNGKLLRDTKFEIYDESGENIVVKGKTDNKGVAEFELEYGKYFYREYEAHDKYILDDRKFPFEIKENGEIVKAQMTNERKLGSLKVTKVDKDSNETLAGAVFELYDSNDQLLSSATTDSEGVFTVKELPIGKYYIKEKTAPIGYETDDSKHKFEVKEHEETIELKIENTKLKSLPKTGIASIKLVVPVALLGVCGLLVYRRKR